MTLPPDSRIKLGTPPCRCGYPSVTRVGPFDGSNYTLNCPGCGKARALVSQPTMLTIASLASSISTIFGAPAEVITLRHTRK